MTAGVLRALKYGNVAQLEAPAKQARMDEGFYDAALVLEARKRLHKVLEKANEAGGTKEKVLDGVLALGMAYNQMRGVECRPCFKRAKEGFVWLLGENCAKAVNAALVVASQTSVDGRMVEYRRLWEIARISLPDEAVTFDIASSLGF